MLSPEESASLARLGGATGGDFYKLLNEIPQSDPDLLRSLANAVTRPQAQQAIYGALQDLADTDDVAAPERRLLQWLAGEWQL
jgi:hypothetical protein